MSDISGSHTLEIGLPRALAILRKGIKGAQGARRSERNLTPNNSECGYIRRERARP